MATSSITLPTIKAPIHRSNFLGQTHIFSTHHRSAFPVPKQQSNVQTKPVAKFDLWELLGGRGLCNGEKGIQQELERSTEPEISKTATEHESNLETGDSSPLKVPERAFDKELMGLTGGFPGGEKGLQKFIEQNPPPPKQETRSRGSDVPVNVVPGSKKPKAPELPLLMPGMIAIVKNPNNPYYMYCGIVQRITDGKAGVLFEGGNWDRLITFQLDELERREKGPPGKNPKSCVLEPLIEQMQQEASK